MIENKSTTTPEVENLPQKIIGSVAGFIRIILKSVGQILLSLGKTIGSFILILILLSFIGGFFSGNLKSQPVKEVHISGQGEAKIDILTLDGIILNSPDTSLTNSAKAIIPTDVEKILSQLEKDEKVKGLIVEVESPGGSAVASDRIYTLLQNFKKNAHLPIVAVMGDTAASGGYFISTAADKIVANPATLTGSIGVIATNLKLMGLMEKLGIKEEVYKTGEFKDILSSYRETTPKEKEIINSILDDAYQLFLDRVSQGRNMPKDQIKPLANGRVFSGKGAKEAGLIDELGNLEEAVKLTKDLAHLETAEVVRIESGGLIEHLFSSISLGWISHLLTSSTQPRVWYLMQ